MSLTSSTGFPVSVFLVTVDLKCSILSYRHRTDRQTAVSLNNDNDDFDNDNTFYSALGLEMQSCAYAQLCGSPQVTFFDRLFFQFSSLVK